MNASSNKQPKNIPQTPSNQTRKQPRPAQGDDHEELGITSPQIMPSQNDQHVRRAVSGTNGNLSKLVLEIKPTEVVPSNHPTNNINNERKNPTEHQSNSQHSSKFSKNLQNGLGSNQGSGSANVNKVNQDNVNMKESIINKFKRPSSSAAVRKERQQTNKKTDDQAKLRHVQFDVPLLPQLAQENSQFIPNGITTTKYTIWSFLPKALLIQFKRMSNVYFLATAILTTIPGFSPISPASTFAPLSFVIFMSMLREAYEDFKRRRNDKLTNNRVCRVLKDNQAFSKEFGIKDTWDPSKCHTKDQIDKLRSSFSECLWKDVKCGDILLIEEGEHLSADCVFLLSSADNGECFVQTATLDGERALKHKQCLAPVKKAIETNGLNNFQCTINCEPPNKNLYEFSGYMESEQLPEKGTISLKNDSKKRTITVDNKQLGLRGSNLANTAWAIASVVYTGVDTKLMLNQGNSRFKQSRIEKVVNRMCIYLFIAQVVLCIIMSIFSGYYVSNYAELTQDGLRRKAEYIFYTELSQFGRSMNGTATDSQTINYSPATEGTYTYGVYFILLNTIIPLSLVVSIEFIKLTQTAFIGHDVNLFDYQSMKPCQPLSMTLHEELASVSYIFADKTGTLTANIMQFKACTIGSVCYDEEYRDEDYDYIMDEEDQQSESQSQQNDGIREVDIRLEVNESPSSQMNFEEFEKFKENNQSAFNERGKEAKTKRRRGSITKIVWNFDEAQMIIKNLLQKNRYFYNEEINLGQSNPQQVPLILKKQNEYLHYFWLNVALCHDVITTISNKELDNGTIEEIRTYQGTSPDEITLLDAAKEVGYTFLDRTSDSMKITIFGQPKTYRLLQKFEFTSERKKMTVIVQDEQSGHIILFSKGADLAIFERLSQQIEQHFLEATKEDLIKFSTKGFRTLCFGIRILDQNYFSDWLLRYETAKLECIKLGAQKVTSTKPIIDPNQILIALQTELESELFLLGATALEDKLQDGVPEAIEDFRTAGIKVWMLTGDKLETAENIGFSSKMFNEKMYIFKLQTPDKGTTRTRLQQIEQKIFEIEKQHATPVIGTQFILNPNAATDYEAKNIIRALEEFKHESRASEFTMNDSWARKPTLRRKVRKRLEEIMPDRNAIAERLIRENQVFFKPQDDQMQYLPQSFDIKGGQYIFKGINVYRSAASQRMKQAKNGISVGGININIPINNETNSNIIDNEDKFGILIEGHTLAFIQDSKSMKEKFLKILAKCEAVIVCRASPSQKGQVVELIKESEPNAVTLAIGDGANDVNMIQKAHLGIGIFGKEGYQAAGSSDYAIGQFRFLRRLLFVHGRWNGVRLTLFMLLFFNKNLFFTLPQFWFGWNNGFSGQSFYDEVYMSAFNLFATNFAICAFAVWEQDVPADEMKQQGLVDLFMPQIYQYSKENDMFTTRKFLGWSAVSVMQSLFMYGVPQLAYDTFIFDGGKTQDFWAQSLCSYFSLVILHYATACFFTRNWTSWITFLYLLSMAFFAPFQIMIYDSMGGHFLSFRLEEIAFSDWRFWLTALISVALCLIPFLFYHQANSLLFPQLKDLIIQQVLDQKQVLDEADPKKTKAAMDMLKKKQMETLQKWEQEYNTFPTPQMAGGAAQTNSTQINLVTSTPNKVQNSPWRKAPPATGQTVEKPHILLERIPEEEELKIQELKDIQQNQESEVVFPDHKLAKDVSPLRMSASRKGLTGFKHQNSLNREKSQLLTVNDGLIQPKRLSPSPLSNDMEDNIPLRISNKGASPEIIEEVQDFESIARKKDTDGCMLSEENLSSARDQSMLDQKMEIIRGNSIFIDEKSFMTRGIINNRKQSEE